MDKKTKTFVVRILRKASLKYYARNQALKNAFVRAEGRKHVVECSKCKEEFFRKEVQVDHINSVIPIYESESTILLDTYAERLFCGIDGFQVLCIPCHGEKTNLENSIRLQYDRKELTKDEAHVKLEELLIMSGFKHDSKTKNQTKTKSSESTSKKPISKKKSNRNGTKSRTGYGSRTGSVLSKSKGTRTTSKLHKK